MTEDNMLEPNIDEPNQIINRLNKRVSSLENNLKNLTTALEKVLLALGELSVQVKDLNER